MSENIWQNNPCPSKVIRKQVINKRINEILTNCNSINLDEIDKYCINSYESFMKDTFEKYFTKGKKQFYQNIFKGTKFKNAFPIINLEHGPI